MIAVVDKIIKLYIKKINNPIKIRTGTNMASGRAEDIGQFCPNFAFNLYGL